MAVAGSSVGGRGGGNNCEMVHSALMIMNDAGSAGCQDARE